MFKPRYQGSLRGLRPCFLAGRRRGASRRPCIIWGPISHHQLQLPHHAREEAKQHKIACFAQAAKTCTSTCSILSKCTRAVCEKFNKLSARYYILVNHVYLKLVSIIT